MACSQNFITREHILYSELLYNPAIAGTKDDVVFVVTDKRNWIGIKDAPRTAILNIHMKADDLGFSKPKKYISNFSTNIGLGLSLYNDRNGPLSVNGIQISYAYHLLLTEETKLSMGISTKITQYSLNETIFKAVDMDDPLISWNKINATIPNINSGLWLYNNKYFTGLSFANLIDFNKQKNVIYYKENIRTLYLTGGYNIFISKSTLEPVILVRYLNNNTWIDATLKYKYKNCIWLSASYESPNLSTICLAIKYRKYCLGYGYEYSFSPIYNYTYGNHQIFIGYNLN